MNVCIKENGIINASYAVEIQNERNCGCVSCIRRCCKPGFIYKQKYCYGNSTYSLNLSLYADKDVFVRRLENNGEHFIVGPPKCVMFKLKFPQDEFYIQESSKDVWVPKYKKFYNSNRYCVDEQNGLTPLLCFSDQKQTIQSAEQNVQNLYSTGMY